MNEEANKIFDKFAFEIWKYKVWIVNKKMAQNSIFKKIFY